MVAVFVVAYAKPAKGTAPAAPANAIEVTLKEFSITPSEITAPPGEVTLRVTNSGTTDHDFEIVGQGKTKRLSPGQSELLILKSVPVGHYSARCNIIGHSSAGMAATLIVSPGAVAGGSATVEKEMTPEEMDAHMAAVAKSFPAATAGHGGDILAPTIQPDGTKQFDVTARIVDWEVEPGKIVKAWTYNGVVPAPTIKVNVGDKVRIVHHNALPESTAIHFHGIKVPNAMDGVPPYTQDVIKPGATFTYEFTAVQPAVGIYHSPSRCQATPSTSPRASGTRCCTPRRSPACGHGTATS
jgi:manganese oxidase